MPFKRAVVLLLTSDVITAINERVSMPFKRAVVLLFADRELWQALGVFQCPLSGQLCCCRDRVSPKGWSSGFNAL